MQAGATSAAYWYLCLTTFGQLPHIQVMYAACWCYVVHGKRRYAEQVGSTHPCSKHCHCFITPVAPTAHLATQHNVLFTCWFCCLALLHSPGAIKDSVVGEEAIVRFLISQISSNPRHAAALQAAQQPGYKLPGSSSSRLGYDAAARKRQEAKAKELRSALAAAAASAGTARLSYGFAAGGLAHASASLQESLQESAQWHPGDDDAYDASDAQLDVLLQKLGVAGLLNPSAQTGACIRLLQAFRAGELGQYMLDVVE
jgi:hypothetical protein